MARPRDLSDLMLAPVALAVDRRLGDLGALPVHRLAERVAVLSGRPDWSTDLRERALLEAVTHLLDLRGWRVDWDPRGVRLRHGQHRLVLGVPPVFAEYRAGRYRNAAGPRPAARAG